MKTKLCTLVGLLILAIFGLVTLKCSRADKIGVETVEDPLAKQEFYQIIGRILDRETMQPMVNASVVITGEDKANTDNNGNYAVRVMKKGSYKITFTQDGYKDITMLVEIPENAENRSSIIINALLIKLAPEYEVKPDEATTITNQMNNPELYIPAGAVSQTTKISMTVYNPVSKEDVGFIIAASFTPEDFQFNTPITFKLNKFSSSRFIIPNLRLFLWDDTNMTWKFENKNVEFDKTENAYLFQLSHFSSYALGFPINKTKGAPVESSYINGSLEVNNADNFEAIRDVVIKVNQWSGWDYATSLDEVINKKIPGLSESDLNALKQIINESIFSDQGIANGYSSIALPDMVTNVSGGSVLSYRNVALMSTDIYNLTVDVDGYSTDLSIPVNVISGSKETYINAPADVHSGGAGA